MTNRTEWTIVTIVVVMLLGVFGWQYHKGQVMADECMVMRGELKKLYRSALCMAPDGRVLKIMD
jgi:hypothetical protein